MDSLPLSALQHWLFCARQCCLIHVEGLWSENRLTAEGRILHERADAGHPESRDGARILRAVQIGSDWHGLHGVADIVELRDGQPYPVEYKRGRPKAHRADEVQLCGQAICLEEMTGKTVPEGALFYGKNRRRKIVAMDDVLRDLTLTTAARARAAIDAGRLQPPVFDDTRCPACSLQTLCQPKLQRIRGPDWMARCLSRTGVPE